MKHRGTYKHRWQSIIRVRCSKCGDFNERKVKFINIEEDIQGRDLMTFVCPKCGEIRKSYRFG